MDDTTVFTLIPFGKPDQKTFLFYLSPNNSIVFFDKEQLESITPLACWFDLFTSHSNNSFDIKIPMKKKIESCYYGNPLKDGSSII